MFGLSIIRTDDLLSLREDAELWRSGADTPHDTADEDEDLKDHPETMAMLQQKAQRRNELIDHLAMLCERVTYWKHGQVPARDRLSLENARMRRALERAGISADPPEATFDVG